MDLLTPWFTVVGVWPTTGERWMGNYQALSARVAEDMARFDTQEAWHDAGMPGAAQFWVCGVFEGKHHRADVYARYIDPDLFDE
jgi:hypothetical protein